jgi:hypothetical protein
MATPSFSNYEDNPKCSRLYRDVIQLSTHGWNADGTANLGAFSKEEIQERFREIRYKQDSSGSLANETPNSAINREEIRGLNKESGGVFPVPRTPVQLDPSKESIIQYGFESEFTFQQLQGILKYYAPDPELGVATNTWIRMSLEERQKWLIANQARVFPSDREPGKLQLIRTVREVDGILPERLIRDSTGNIEIVMGPFDSLEELKRRSAQVVELFGEGSMQTVISLPRAAFFRGTGGAGNLQASVQENLGFLTFFSDYDTLEKLSMGLRRWESRQDRRTARSFEHPFLGPLTKQKHDLLRTHLAANAEGKLFDKETRASIAGADDSYKYIGGTSYRPDIVGKKRPAIEVRDAHDNRIMLINKAVRNTFYLQYGRESFRPASELIPFDAPLTFSRFSAEVQSMLKTLFPNKAKPNVTYNESEKLALDVFNNFSWPMRDWRKHLDFLDAKPLETQLLTAQKSYEDRLTAIAQDLKSGVIDNEKAAVAIQGALVEFGEKSGLRTAFMKREMALAEETAARFRTTFGEYLTEIDASSGSLRQWLPDRVMAGPLSARTEAFAKEFPFSTRIIPSVGVQIDDPEVPAAAARTVLLVSTNGMNKAQREKLKERFLYFMSHRSLSHPLRERGNHLYSRLGHQVIDFEQIVGHRPYHFPHEKGKDGLETFMDLTPNEFLNLRTYLEAANADSPKVVGHGGYFGNRGNTVGRLDDNRPSPGGINHNCVSWICTAPVGARGEPIYELAGATKSQEVHTNPGWWSSWLAAGANQSRSPMLVLFSDKPLAEVIAERLPNNQLNWDFDRR